MAAAWYVLVVLTATFAAGVPLAWLLGGCKALSRSAWIRAPFVGISGLVLVLQNLFYLDVPVARAAPLLWLGLAALWVVMCRRGQLGESFRHCPRALLAAALAVYLVHGLGLFAAGARAYLGRAWTDQLNYTAYAEAAAHLPFSKFAEGRSQQPYLNLALRMKIDRVGQSLLHGLFAVSSRGPVRALLVPIILLMPALVVLAAYALCRRLGLRSASSLLTAVTAGLLPALALMHLEGFLSQALATPLLLFFPVLLHDLARRPGWRTLGPAALVMAGTTAIYTEVWLLLMGSATLVLGLAVRRGRCGERPWRRLVGCWVVLLLAPVALNPGVLRLAFILTQRLGLTQLNHVYPWAFRVEGLVRLWFGDAGAALLGSSAATFVGGVGVPASGLIPSLVRALALGLTGLGLFGLAQACLANLPRGEGWRDPARRSIFALSCGILALALLPVCVVARDDNHAYQFYKLLLMQTPLLAVGLGLFGHAVQRHLGGGRGRWLTVGLLGPVAAGALAATTRMVIEPVRLRPAPRSLASGILAPDFLALQEQLERLSGQDLFLWYADDSICGSHVAHGWLAYSARHNRLWLGNPLVNDYFLEEEADSRRSLDLTELPKELIVLTGQGCPLRPTDLPAARLLWGNRSYQLWRTSGLRLAVLGGVADAHGLNGTGVPSRFWMSGSATLTLWTNVAGRVVLSADVTLGPSLPPNALRRMRIDNPARGYCGTVTLTGGPVEVEVPVAVGLNKVVLTPLDTPWLGGVPAGTPPALFLIAGLRARLRPEPPSYQYGGARSR
jgi:hypothetical protein